MFHVRHTTVYKRKREVRKNIKVIRLFKQIFCGFRNFTVAINTIQARVHQKIIESCFLSLFLDFVCVDKRKCNKY